MRIQLMEPTMVLMIDLMAVPVIDLILLPEPLRIQPMEPTMVLMIDLMAAPVIELSKNLADGSGD